MITALRRKQAFFVGDLGEGTQSIKQGDTQAVLWLAAAMKLIYY